MNFYRNYNNFIAGNMNMSYEQCQEIAPDLAFKSINDIYCSADDIFKRVGDGILVSFVKLYLF